MQHQGCLSAIWRQGHDASGKLNRPIYLILILLFGIYMLPVSLSYLLLIIILFQQDALNRSRKESDGVTFIPMKQNVKKIFTEAQEEHLANYTVKLAKMFYGLSRTQFKRLAYRYVDDSDTVKIPQSIMIFLLQWAN